ncbi:MAG: cation-translocating P-type ATPase [Clostridia bacterium]|nr:cation-translocating P-type ATPase [Clostridia bacterium]
MQEYYLSKEDALKKQSSGASGLAASEAEQRLARFGENALAQPEKPTLFKRFLEQIKNPMIIVLIAAAAVSLITEIYSGEPGADAIIIAAVVLLNAILGVVQEYKAEQAIDALNKIAASTCKVIRDGNQTTIKATQVVPGDILVLEAGDAVAADARLIEVASLKVEEAALTGESLPVTKTTEPFDSAKPIPLGDRKNMVYMGSSIAYGRGLAVVTATGMNTEMGNIADALNNARDGQTPLQKKLASLSKTLSFLVLGICVLVFAIDIIGMAPDVTLSGLLDTFMIAVSLAVAAIPEGLATVVTIVLSIGVTNMSRRGAIIRRMTAVETLGCAGVICSDKTGTLTKNLMTVVETSTEDERALARAMALSSDAVIDDKGEVQGEPTEAALVAFAEKLGFDKRDCGWTRVAEAPFDSVRKMMSTINRSPDGKLVQFSKGAPDEIIRRCTKVLTDKGVSPLTDDVRRELLSANKDMADRALRVLAAASRDWEGVAESVEADNIERDMCFIGLTGMIDPVRDEVKSAIELCAEAGIRPVMITGDHPDTARAIAKQLGIITRDDEAITGAMLDEISDADFERDIDKYSVYARVQPDNKVRIVKGWQKKGCVVAMTGDGVNDAPSIKNADIGVGMGITGTDVTKNVADMVLTDDNFATIVSAVEEGRRIYDNIRKAIQFLLSSNLSEVVAIFAATVMGFTVLKPAHLLWINLITDTFPALALGVEKAENDIMMRPPRDPSEGIFAGGVGRAVVFQGVVVAAITLAAYFIGHYIEAGEWAMVNSPDGTTMAFLTLSLTEAFHSFNMRSLSKSSFAVRTKNAFLWGAMAVSIALTALVVFVPALARAFSFEPVSAGEYLICLALAILIVPIVEIEKLIRRKSHKNRE